MMVVLSLATGLAVASLRLLDAVSTLRKGTRAEMQTFRDLHRLADQLRKDAHQADEGRTADDETVLVLTSTGGENLVRYQIVDSAVRRVSENGSASDVVSREGFQLPSETSVQWSVNDEASLVRLQVTSQRSRIPTFSLEAVLGVEDQE